MKKYIFIIILCYFNVSCQTYSPIGMPYMSDIYISPRNAAADDTYIILREQPKVFEIQYSSQIGSVTFGGWNMMNDTLYLYPRYESGLDGPALKKLREILPEDQLTWFNMPQKYVIDGDKLIDKTDLTIVFTGELEPFKSLFSSPSNITYLRIPMKASKFKRKYSRLKRADTWEQVSCPSKENSYDK